MSAPRLTKGLHTELKWKQRILECEGMGIVVCENIALVRFKKKGGHILIMYECPSVRADMRFTNTNNNFNEFRSGIIGKQKKGVLMKKEVHQKGEPSSGRKTSCTDHACSRHTSQRIGTPGVLRRGRGSGTTQYARNWKV